MATWSEVVTKVGKWYEANVHTYQGTRNKPRKNHPVEYKSPYGSVWDDCTGYVSSCLQIFGVFKKGERYGSEGFGLASCADFKRCEKSLLKGGFVRLPFSWATVRPFDIISVFEGRGAGQKHHAEIYAGKINGKDYSWSWGSIHDKIVKPGVGMPCPSAKYAYRWIWRHNGTNIDTPIYLDDMTYQQSMNQGYGTGGLLNNVPGESNAYPVHDEYVTITAQYGNIFENTTDNAISIASMMNDASWLNPSNFGNTHIRIYSTNDSSIVLDELSLPLYHQKDNYANKGIKGERERDNTARIDRSLYETTDSSTNQNQTVDSSTNKTTTA